MATKAAKKRTTTARRRNRFLPDQIRTPLTLTAFMKKLVAIMKAEPARVDQGDWLRTGEDAYCEIPDPRGEKKVCSCGDPDCTQSNGGQRVRKVAPACGTVGCTAGWASVLLGYKRFPDADQIAEDIGLHILSPGLQNELFDGKGYNKHVSAPAGTKKHMQQVVRGINEFVSEYKDSCDRILVYPKGTRR